MQRGPGVRPEWNHKRLVVVKHIRRPWLRSLAEYQEQELKEIKVVFISLLSMTKLEPMQALRALPVHPNIITLYDAFNVHSPLQTCLILEPMEGTLYHLFKARKGRSFSGVLVASIFHQIASALFHIHNNGYFHRDMKPENILVTTTGLFEYTTISPVAPPDAPKEKDLIVIIKLADFGLARRTNSNPPYTEYVTTRWYRAPEVLLLSRTYGSAVDMWGLGVIMAETLNLCPLFRGTDQVDQVGKICAILGDPSDEYGVDSSGIAIGGGPWPSGIALANTVGFQFPRVTYSNLTAFKQTISEIRVILSFRTSQQILPLCLNHESLPLSSVPFEASWCMTPRGDWQARNVLNIPSWER